MLVPRSFKYSSSLPSESKAKILNESRPKSPRLSSEPVRSSPLTVSTSLHRHSTTSESSPGLKSTMINMQSPSKPVEIPSPRSPTEGKANKEGRSRTQHADRKSRPSSNVHRADSLPPAVAALLAVTAIPPPRRTQSRRQRSSLHNSRQISIDELVQEWRNDSSLRPSFSSGASLGLLLESTDDSADERSSYSRSSSCDSLPSLDADDRSVMSVGSPATPESIRSQGSRDVTPRKEKSFCLIETEDCGVDHPLGFSSKNADMDWDVFSIPAPKTRGDKRRKSTSFTSNLTSSLQALKSRALSSISSLNQAINQADGNFSDDSLWQHPYLFPRLSSEVRPVAFASTPTRSERRYFNPRPIPFDEQQHHWRRALSTIDDDGEDTPMIQMQTYRRSAPAPPRRSRRNSGSPDSKSNAGRASTRALARPQPSRQREVRENSNFLRVIVLEMNMRRRGKLEEGTTGKARIWLPPRKVAVSQDDVFDDDDEDEERALADVPVGRVVPKRWVGISADY